MTTAMDPDRLATALRPPAGPWRQVEAHRSIASTNSRAGELGQPWSIVVAEHQSAGRGRLARSWQAPAGTSLALSATLPAPHHGPGWLPLLSGLAVAEAIEQVSGLSAVLKWPNDVLLAADEHRKVCGILCEYRPATAHHDHLVIVGIGLNLTQTREQLPVPTATSLQLAGGAPSDPVEAIAAILARLHDRYAAWQAGGPRADLVRAAYRRRCATLGAAVRVLRTGAPDLEGIAEQIDDEGTLWVLEPDSGRRHVVPAGDVVHLRPLHPDRAGLA